MMETTKNQHTIEAIPIVSLNPSNDDNPPNPDIHHFKTYQEYLYAFKRTLVSRYLWGVDEASQFHSEKLKQCFEERLLTRNAFIRIFGKEQLGSIPVPD